MSTTKDKIVATMYQLVAEKGYEKASIGRIAEAIDIKKASIYYYFKSKEEIFLTMIDWVYGLEGVNHIGVLENITTAIEYKEYLINYGTILVDWYQQDVDLRKVCCEIDVQSNRIQGVSDRVHEFDQKNEKEVRCILQYGVNLGVFSREFDINLNTQLFETVMHGMDRAILYDLDIASKEIWNLYISKII